MKFLFAALALVFAQVSYAADANATTVSDANATVIDTKASSNGTAKLGAEPCFEPFRPYFHNCKNTKGQACVDCMRNGQETCLEKEIMDISDTRCVNCFVRASYIYCNISVLDDASLSDYISDEYKEGAAFASVLAEAAAAAAVAGNSTASSNSTSGAAPSPAA